MAFPGFCQAKHEKAIAKECSRGDRTLFGTYDLASKKKNVVC